MYLDTEVFIDPVAASRPRFSKHGTYNLPKYTNYKKAMQLILSREVKEPIACPVEVILEFNIEMPKSYSKKKREALQGKYKPMKPDIDNYIKGVLDSMNEIVLDDDCQVVKVTACKKHALAGSIKIQVKEIDEDL